MGKSLVSCFFLTHGVDAFSRAQKPQMRLVAGLHPDLLGELKRSPRFPSRNLKRGHASKGKGKETGKNGGKEYIGRGCLLFI